MRDITPPANWSRRPQYGDRSRSLNVRSTHRVATRSTYFDIKAQTVTTVEEIETVTMQPVAAVRSVPELPVEQKVNIMVKALDTARKDLDKERRKKTLFKRASLVLVSAVILLSTGYVGFDTWMTNNRLKVGAESVPVSTAAVISTDVAQAEEGTDETKPPASALDSYVVSPNLPRALYINKISVAARLMPMNVNTDGSLQAPKNIYDAGWYTSSVKPGEDGAMLIDGHASGKTRQGLFGYLDTLKVDDQIQIEKGDGTKLTYKVLHTETVPLADVDMQKMLTPYGDAKKGLNLMTCTGTWIASEKTYDERALIFAEQV